MNETIDELKRSLAILASHGIRLESFEMLLRAHAAALEEIERLTARVAELEKDEARLRFLADEPLFDQLGEIDLHEEAAINSSALGRDEPNSNDYLAAIRTAIDAARSKP